MQGERKDGNRWGGKGTGAQEQICSEFQLDRYYDVAAVGRKSLKCSYYNEKLNCGCKVLTSIGKSDSQEGRSLVGGAQTGSQSWATGAGPGGGKRQRCDEDEIGR